MARYTFPGDLFFYEGSDNAVLLGAEAAFRVYTDRTGGSDITSQMTQTDGSSSPTIGSGGDILADGDGQRPWLMGPQDVAVIYIDAATGERYPVYGVEAITDLIAGGGGGGGTGLTAEDVRDTMATALVGGTNVTVTPNDIGDTITIAAAGASGLDAEAVRDTMAAALVAGANVTITVNDAADTITIASTGGGGSAVSNAPTLIVAASDSTQTDKDAATADGFLAGSTNAHVQIQAALDAAFTHAAGGGTVKLCPGTYNIGANQVLSMGHPTDGTGTYRVNLLFERGARVLATSHTGTTPIIKIESSDCTIVNPWVQGSGNKGLGTGICFGGDTTNYGGRWTKTVYRCAVVTPALISNCNYGIETAIDKTGTSSSGDNNIIGGFITNCKEGWRNAGFVNRMWGTTIAGCDLNIHGTGDRNSQKMGVFGVTSNNYATASIWLEKDHGSTFVDFWSEHTAAQSGTPVQAILFGNTTNVSYTAHNTKFVGTTFLTLNDEQYAIRAIRANSVTFDNLVMSTDGAMPTTAIFRQDATFASSAPQPPPLIRCKRLSWMTGTVPATWDYATKAISKDSSSTGKVIIESVPGPAGTTPTNVAYGDLTPVPSQGTYRLDVSGVANNAVYWAKRFDGHIAAFAADTTTTSGWKAVLQGLAATGVHFELPANSRFHFKDAPLGNESWAGVEDHAAFNDIKGLTFSGGGMYSTTVSNRSNAAADTEPLSFTNCQHVTMHDFAVEACGSYRSTSDALDFDQGAHNRIQRIRVLHSRGRGVIHDGGDPGKWSGHNVVEECRLQGRPGQPQLTLISGGSLAASASYRYVVSWTDSDLAGAQVAGETKPSDEAVVTTDTTNKSVRVELSIGPYSVTERKVYRAVVGSSSWVRVATISDNTTITFTDTGGAGTSVTMPVSHRSTIYDSAIEMLGSSYNTVAKNTIDGTGDFTSGLNRHGVNISRKATVPTLANYNEVYGNKIRQCAGNALRVIGGIGNDFHDNMTSNSGTVTTRAANMRVEGATGVSTLRNLFKDNTCFDDQDASSWSTGQTVNNQMQISATGTPTTTIVTGNILTPGASGSAATILDQGTDSLIWDNYGFGSEFSLLELGVDQTANFTVAQAMSSQTIRINSASTVTVTLPVLKAGTTIKLIRWGAGAVNLAVSGTTLNKPSTNSASPRAQFSAIQLDWVTTTDIVETGDMG